MWIFLGSVAALAMGGLQDPDVDRWVAGLAAEDPAERDRAGAALEAIGVPALEALKASLQHPDPEVRMRVLEITRRISGIEGEAYGSAVQVAWGPGEGALTSIVRGLCGGPGVDFRMWGNWNSQVPAGTERVQGPFFEVVDRLCRAAGRRVRYVRDQERPGIEGYGYDTIDFEPRVGADLPVVYSGPLRIAVESVSQSVQVGPGGGDRSIRLLLSVVWQRNVRPWNVEVSLEEALAADGARPAIRGPAREVSLGMFEFRLDAAPRAGALRVRGRVRLAVPEVLLTGGADMRRLRRGGHVRMSGLAFRPREGPDGESLLLFADREDIGARLCAVWVSPPPFTTLGEMSAALYPSEIAGAPAAIELRTDWSGISAGAFNALLAGETHDHPFEFEFPYPAFWPASE